MTAADRERGEVLELYKLAVEAVTRVSAQRGVANAFYLTVQTAFASVLGLSLATLRDTTWWVALAISFIGLLLSVSWWLQLRAYRRLNRAKLAVIHELETRLPVRLFTAEWRELGGGPPEGNGRGRLPAGLGTVEQIVPAAFGALHLVIGLGGVL
ncbi:RipA family octameric membrane protein [Streptomyces specialis]|uniref:RipA family octameric membrane protein n=1 Tax=Streptomyces specialis TaxID=498367 RepID=UPI000AFBA89C|nr:hypothetical protein [Streptomyces specialis]